VLLWLLLAVVAFVVLRYLADRKRIRRLRAAHPWRMWLTETFLGITLGIAVASALPGDVDAERTAVLTAVIVAVSASTTAIRADGLKAREARQGRHRDLP
jgi:hypothetical protein